LKFLIVIPTLNEEKNISIIYNRIFKIYKNAHILFIDDNSTDGSRKEIIDLRRKNKKVHFIFRNKKFGIGSAHKEGLLVGIKKKFRYILTMDCDGTHHPKYIDSMFRYIESHDIILTNRFLKKNSIKGWEIKRVLITKIRYYLVRILLGSKLDSSGGFRLYDFKKINIKDILKAKNNDYSFLIESTIILEKSGYKIFEIPIVLSKRVLGNSKMKLMDIFFGIILLLKYFKKRIFRKFE
jgi:dolichol-phosphate mannosyltransferase